jgi:hypothetical protein
VARVDELRDFGDRAADIATPTGPMRLHVFQPAVPGRYPGLVLYSEIYQITGSVRRMAAFLAGNGFVVVAPEIYHEFEAPGTVLAYDKPGTDRGNELKSPRKSRPSTTTRATRWTNNITIDQWRQMLEGKGVIYAFVIVKYYGTENIDKVRVSESCRYIIKTPVVLNSCDGHNRIYTEQ